MIEPTHTNGHRLRFFLRDFRMVEARANLAEGQSLASYLSNRRSYLTAQDAVWTGTGERAELVVLRVSQVLWAAAPQGDVQVTASSAAPRAREVVLQLDGGLHVQATLNMVPGQRLADYLESAGGFVPVFRAHLLRSGRPPRAVNLSLGDIVLNQEAIQAVWDATVALADRAGSEAPVAAFGEVHEEDADVY